MMNKSIDFLPNLSWFSLDFRKLPLIPRNIPFLSNEMQFDFVFQMNLILIYLRSWTVHCKWSNILIIKLFSIAKQTYIKTIDIMPNDKYNALDIDVKLMPCKQQYSNIWKQQKHCGKNKIESMMKFGIR